ncbi:MAG: chemotaxis protein CheW [Bacteroidales bacterium]
MSNSTVQTDSYILFQLGDNHFALPSVVVKQLDMVESITPIPGAPFYVEGIVFSRGLVIPVVNLRLRLGMEYKQPDMRSRMIIIYSHNRHIGLIVDSARDFVHLQADSILPPPENVAGLSGNYLMGIAHLKDRLVIVLNVDALMNEEVTDNK